MGNYKIGVQMHPMREEFAKDPLSTLKRVKEMGYDGAEITMGALKSGTDVLTAYGAPYFKKAFEETGLECFGLFSSWWNLQPEFLDRTLEFAKTIKAPILVLGSINPKNLETEKEAKEATEYMHKLTEIFAKEGILVGYHNHDTDFIHKINGKSFFEYVMENTPDNFVMLIDTGNAKAVGYDAIELINNYPHRTPYIHLKPYSEKDGMFSYFEDDNFNWDNVISTAIQTGNTKVFTVEYAEHPDKDPFIKAKKLYDTLSSMLKNY